MSKIIILGDPHIGKGCSIGKVGLGSSLNSRIIDQLNLLDWVYDKAIELCCDRIVITGDVFEEPKPAPYLITLFISWLKKCAQDNIIVDIILGNHDTLRTSIYYNSCLDVILEADIKNINIYKNITTIFIDNNAITFVPFRDRKSFDVDSNIDALKSLKRIINYEIFSIPKTYNKFLIGHLAIEGSIPIGDEIDDLNNELFCPIDMFIDYDYVWMGHVHNPQVCSKKPYVAHIGSMDISNFAEGDSKKHIVILDLNTKAFSHVELPTRALKKITISVPKDTADTTNFVINEISKIKDIKNAIVKLEINLMTSDIISSNRLEIEKYLYSIGVFNIATITESRKISLVKKENSLIEKINLSLEINDAVKKWCETNIEKDDQSLFLETFSKILMEFKLK